MLYLVHYLIVVITLAHKSSKHGLPVILDDNGKLVEYPHGLNQILKQVGMSRKELALAAGYKSARSIYKFWYGTTPSPQILNVLSSKLNEK